MLIYLADLGHNLLTLSSDVYPLGVANLATWVEAHLKAPEPPRIVLFREPQDLKKALDAQPPDVLGFPTTRGTRNCPITSRGTRRRRIPADARGHGRPELPLVESVQEQFLAVTRRPSTCYVDGPTYEGERAFLNLVQRCVGRRRRARGRLRGTRRRQSLDRSARPAQFVKGGEVERITDLDEIPSPYLAGLAWIRSCQTGYFPMLQIARGLPVHLRLLQFRRRVEQQDLRALGRERQGRPAVHRRARQARDHALLRRRQLRHVRARRGDRRLHRLAAGHTTTGRATSAPRPARTTASASSA